MNVYHLCDEYGRGILRCCTDGYGWVEVRAIELCDAPKDYRAYRVVVDDNRAGRHGRTLVRETIAEMTYYDLPGMKSAAAAARARARELAAIDWP